MEVYHFVVFMCIYIFCMILAEIGSFSILLYSQTHKKCVSIILQRYSMTCYYFERFQVLWMDVNDQSCSKTVDRMTEQKNCVWRTEPFYTSCESPQNKKKAIPFGALAAWEINVALRL